MMQSPYGSLQHLSPCDSWLGCPIDLDELFTEPTPENRWLVFQDTYSFKDVGLLRGDPDEAIARWGNSDQTYVEYLEGVEWLQSRAKKDDEEGARRWYDLFVEMKRDYNDTNAKRRMQKIYYCWDMPELLGIPEEM